MLGPASLLDYPVCFASAFAFAVTWATSLDLGPDLETAYSLHVALPFGSPTGLAILIDLPSAQSSALAFVA